MRDKKRDMNVFDNVNILASKQTRNKKVERSHAEINGHTVFRHLVKRWNEEIFGCHCSFTIHCTTDSNCHAHGHQFRCVADCCGTKCHAVSETTESRYHGR
uniref:Uncharacterized protein LOC111101601 isoform X2 n=1 Tax=Crassostrea virginica TaxID=6565 RepID=A0A8B8AH35_CRAVI|nr:uncharacterized protein LOC111101601 isoform X2 [Crassostrea virginica]XP_022290043.1 uncharacterized protein LOC111101741 isoform X2 [Crassostrea virginica]